MVHQAAPGRAARCQRHHRQARAEVIGHRPADDTYALKASTAPSRWMASRTAVSCRRGALACEKASKTRQVASKWVKTI